MSLRPYPMPPMRGGSQEKYRSAGGLSGGDGLPTWKHLKEFDGWTNKFIFPPYDFSVANSMVTNFHLPLSTLLMLVAAYGGYDLVMEAYHTALKEDYRFGTYGDAMLILDK